MIFKTKHDLEKAKSIVADHFRHNGDLYSSIISDDMDCLEIWLPSRIDDMINEASDSNVKSQSRKKALERAEYFMKNLNPFKPKKGERKMATTAKKAVKKTAKKSVSKKSVSKKSVSKKSVSKKSVSKKSVSKKSVSKKSVSKKSTSETAAAKYADDMKITMKVKTNPHREGSSSFKVFELLSKSKTVKDFVKAVAKNKIGNGSPGRAKMALSARIRMGQITVK